MSHIEATTEKENKYNKYKTASAAHPLTLSRQGEVFVCCFRFGLWMVRGGGGMVGVVKGRFVLLALDIILQYGSRYTTYIVGTI